MTMIAISPPRVPLPHPARIAGWAAATVVATFATAPADAATRVTFDSNADRSISLAGSTSPLYGVAQSSESRSVSQTIRKCNEAGKFGTCPGGYSNVTRTTTTWYDYRDFVSASADALIGIKEYTGTMPTADEVFTTDYTRMYTRAQIRSVSDQGYSPVPFVPSIQDDYPVRGAFVHLKFKVNGTTYVGLAKFDNSNNPGLSYIEYEALPGAASAVPEPESWALLIAGIGMTGAAARRSRRREQRAQAAM